MPTVTARERNGLPGDKLAVIEEFEAGVGTYFNEDVIRAAVLGEVVKDFKTRSISVKARKSVAIPKAGDIVIGQVESVQGNLANIRIHYLNGVVTQTGFLGLLITRQNMGRGAPRGRPQTVCKLGDLVRAKVAGNVDMVITLTFDAPECGVLYSICSICGNKLITVDSRLKCVECGNMEFRRLASDYGKAIFR